nr:proto-oncogene tyrosine-protein kinase receptor Ret isoform X1 [Aedes albopictus]
MNSHVHYQLLNDSYQLFEPKCVTYEIDHDGTRQTVFSCSLIARKSGILPKGRYCVVLKVVDDTVSSSVDPNLFDNSTICIDPSHNHLLLPRPEPLISGDHSGAVVVDSKPARSGGNGGSGGKKRSSNKVATALANFTYPRKVELYTSATQFARIAQPSNMYDQIADGKTDLNYRILINPLDAFGITESAGIIYLNNSANIQKQLSNVSLNLVVAWLNHNATIQISIKISSGISCNVTSEDFCSAHPNQTSCINSCGVGSREGTCKFRISDPASAFGGLFSKPEESTFDENYPTCSPDLDYCPDNVCDPLEDMGHKRKIQICPQDCVYPDEIIGVFERLHTTARGIHMSGAGTCTCRRTGQCDCVSRLGIKKEHRKNNTKTRTGKTSTTTEPVVLFNGTNGASSPAAVRDGGNYYQNGLINGPNAPMFLLAIVVIPMIVAVLLVSYCFSRKTGLKKKLADGNNIPMHMVSNETEVFNVDLPLNSRINDINFKIDFDSKWEFPRTNLILDITLGEGEFGKVLKAYATDLPDKPGITTVAVKMLKTGANSVELLALLSEYQLLQEVTHPNVIRLLGACTKGDSPLLIIEYCLYGSLKNYLRLSRKLEVMNATDYENAIEPITVKDILSFAWQISKGMAYLTEIKLVHRDLAARNVLLAEGKVCKISDFGLTRDVYEDDAYLKKSKDRVPVKWMAPESLADHIYTTKSDVWAFGVVCWELITLGASPYPGIPPQNLYTLLKQGYRMECPKNCSEEIYSIVRSCWADDPKLRPSFKYLAGQFEQLLGRTAKYIDMEQNSISNPVYCENSDETDCSKVSFVKEEQERLESLWTPPQYEPATDSSTLESIRYLSPITDKKSLILQSYDTPRPLIETATIEQKLRYENDVRLRPRKIHNGVYPPSSTPTIYINSSSHPNLFSNRMDETSFSVVNATGGDYDSPSRQPRPVSYLDMNKNSVNLNLEINNIVDKKQSKDIAFRFSSVDNDLQTVGDALTTPTQSTVIPIIGRVQSDSKLDNNVGGGRDEVDFMPGKLQNKPEVPPVTVTSTV